jgi:ferredoxin-NADP reductase
MSMMRALNADGRRYKLYYLTRSREHTAFSQ